jgi:hypothetical protein
MAIRKCAETDDVLVESKCSRGGQKYRPLDAKTQEPLAAWCTSQSLAIGKGETALQRRKRVRRPCLCCGWMMDADNRFIRLCSDCGGYGQRVRTKKGEAA